MEKVGESLREEEFSGRFHHRPFDDPVFDHEVLHERAVHLRHVVVVFFVAQVGPLVGADGPAEEAGRGLGEVVHCSLVGW